MSSTHHHGDSVEMEQYIELNATTQSSNRKTSIEAQPTPIFAFHPPNEPERVHSRPPSPASEAPDVENSATKPLLSTRPQTPTEPRWSSEDYDIRPSRSSEATERPSTSSTADSYTRLASADARGRAKPITRNGWLRFFSGWVVHFPALIATIAIVISSRHKRFWFHEEGIRGSWDDPKPKISAKVINNTLQLPAKLHELLIIASLSSIAVAMFRRRLIGDGVRLGFLTGGYRVGDIPYLQGAAFWRQGVDIYRPWEILLAGFVVFATIISTLVNPTSAGLLIPALGWYPVDHADAFYNITLPLSYRQSARYIWPKNLSVQLDPFMELDYCQSVTGIYNPRCPAGGFSELYAWVQSFRASDLSKSLRFQFPPTRLHRELVFTQANPSVINSTTLCTTPPHFLMVSLGLFQDYIDSKNVGSISGGTRYRLETNPTDTKRLTDKQELLQPFVQSKCRFAPSQASSFNKTVEEIFKQEIEYPAKSLECFNDENCLRFQKEPRSINEFTVPWLADEQWQNEPATSGYSTIGKESSVLTLIGQLPERGEGSVYVCNFLASWVNSTFTIDTQRSDILDSTLNHNETLRNAFHGIGISKPKVITFHRNFIRYMMPTFTLESEWKDGARPQSPIDKIVDIFATHCDSPDDDPEAQCVQPVNITDVAATEAFLSKVFGVYLTEVLARTANRYRTHMILKETSDELIYLDLKSQYGRNSGIKSVKLLNDTHSEDMETGELVPISKARLDKGLPIDFKVERYGYGTGQSGRTVDFALAIMYIYLSVVAVYAAAVGAQHVLEFFGISWRGKRIHVLSVIPWGDLQDLVVLALKSPPPNNRALMDSGAGVSSNRVWDRVVKARADDERNVQLVLDDSTHATTLDDTGRETYF